MKESKNLMQLFLAVFFIVTVIIFSACSQEKPSAKTDAMKATGINKVKHLIVIYMENHSFDNLYGEFPNANNLAQATPDHYLQLDTSKGKAFNVLPWSDSIHISPSPAFANKPFPIDSLLPANMPTRDLVHRYYQEQVQIDGGKMDKFAQISDAQGLTMGYYHTCKLPMYALALQYTVCDNFFHSAFGGSFLNHIYMIAAAPPVFPNAPDTIVAKGGIVTSNGAIHDGAVSPDKFGINTLYTANNPHPTASSDPRNIANPKNYIPNQTMPTIGDRLSDSGISWVWYSGKWNTMLSGKATKDDSALFQYHHQPFIYFDKYADGKPAKKEHVMDEEDFINSLKDSSTPSVSFIKPFGIDNEHPGYTDVITGENHLLDLIYRIKVSSIWNDCVIIVTYDEHGGFWDHVPPPVSSDPAIAKWGPGLRVPGIIISPFSVKGVDHTQYETLSILAFIEKRWGLTPLTHADAAANPFSNALKF